MDKIFYFSDNCAEHYKNSKKFINLSHYQQDFNMDAECTFFVTSHSKSPCDVVGGFFKSYIVKGILQRLLHDQIMSYQSVLDLCVREIPSITFFGVSQEEMVSVHADLKDCFTKSKTSLEQGVATILYQYLPTKLVTNSQMIIESFFNLDSTNR